MAIVNNFEIGGLVRRLRKFKYEANKAVSSSASSVSEADFLRSKSYLAAAEAYIRYVIAQPILDLPESSPFEIDLGEPEVLPTPENESLADLDVMYNLFEQELVSSQSARQPSGMISHDVKRFFGLLEKMNVFLDTYVSSTLPLDLPESAPLRGSTGAGRTGV